MIKKRHFFAAVSAILLALFSSGCATSPSTGKRYQAGQTAGGVIGGATGTVLGNAAVTVTGTGKGVVDGVTAPYNSPTHIVRRWHVEITPDGRTINVPEDILVDANGRPVNPRPAAVPPPQK
jgi:hypothetical protein